MKEKSLKLKDSGLFLFITILLCSIFGIYDGSAMAADVVNPPGGGAVIVNDTTTVTETRVNSKNLLLDRIDEKVAKIRPYDVVLYTISRHVSNSRTSNNQVVRHYAIDVIDLTAALTVAVGGGVQQAALATSNNGIFACEQTIIVKSIKGYKENGTAIDKS